MSNALQWLAIAFFPDGSLQKELHLIEESSPKDNSMWSEEREGSLLVVSQLLLFLVCSQEAHVLDLDPSRENNPERDSAVERDNEMEEKFAARMTEWEIGCIIPLSLNTLNLSIPTPCCE